MSSNAVVAVHQLTLDWKVKKIKPALAAARAGEDRKFETDRPTSVETGWGLLLQLKAGKDVAGLYLRADPTNDDYESATSLHRWTRRGKFKVTMQLFYAEGDLDPLTRSRTFECAEFNSKDSSWGTDDMVSFAALEDPTTSSIRCTVEGPPPLRSKTRHYDYDFSTFYEDPEFSDVVIVVDSGEELPLPTCSPRGRCLQAGAAIILTTVLFASGFSEAGERERLDLRELLKKPQAPYAGDGDDFAAFEAHLPATAATISAEARRTRRSSCPAPSEELPAHDDAESDEPAQKKQKLDGHDTKRSVTKITFKDCSFATFDSFLFYLYSGAVSFLPSASEYLVTAAKTAVGMPLPPRNEWLESRLDAYSATRSCSPHAIYRLADRYFAYHLKDKTQDYLVRSLTVENAAYEAFCQLSVDFADFREPVVKYAVANWDKVKSTAAMKQVLKLLEAGELPGGAEILSEIHDGLTTAKKEEKVEDSRRGR
ncbi:hypothetical protein JCM10213_001005 [Rhodosporidiobolus nylandii]